MNGLDLALLIILLLSILSGAWVGAVNRLVQIAAVLIAFSESWRLAPWIRDHIFPYFNLSSGWVSFLLPILSFVGLYLLLRLVGRFIASFFEGGIVGLLNHILGAGLGLVVGIYALGYALAFVDKLLPDPHDLARNGLEDVRNTSELYYPIRNSISDLEQIYDYYLGSVVNKTEDALLKH